MVTSSEIRGFLGRPPFQPFRVTLSNGETVEVTRIAQAVTTTHQFIVSTPDDRLRWIQLNWIVRIDACALPPAEVA